MPQLLGAETFDHRLLAALGAGQRREQRRQRVSGDIAAQADPGRGTVGLHARLQQDLIVHGEDALRVTHHHLAARGDTQAAATLLQQFRADDLLQSADLGADRRLGEPLRIGGFGQGAQFTHGD